MRLLKLSNFTWILVLVALIFFSIFYAYISTDAPYYLSIARDISNGAVLYKDIYSSYTPVMMYLNAIVYKAFSAPAYQYYLVFQYLIIACSSLLLFGISRKFGKPKILSLFISLFFFLTTLTSDGTYIILEVYVIVFVFLSFLLLQHEKYFLAGFVLAFSFFAKQYGLLNFSPFYLILFLDLRGIQRKLLVFTVGAIVPLVFFMFYFIGMKGVPFNDLLGQLTRDGMNTNMLEVEFNTVSFIAGAKILLLTLIPLLFLKISPFKNKMDVILILGALVNLIPLYIQNFGHYFILVFPYIFILMSKNLKTNERKFILSTNIVLLLISGLLFVRVIKYKNVYNQQLLVAKQKAEEYPKGSDVYLYKGYRYLYILNDYKNPVLEEVGYRYEFYPDEKFRAKYDVLTKDVYLKFDEEE